jgi:hypothetical protein
MSLAAGILSSTTFSITREVILELESSHSYGIVVTSTRTASDSRSPEGKSTSYRYKES